VVEVTGVDQVASMQNRPVNTDLSSVVAALEDLNDGELAALIDAANNAPQIAPGLLAWIEGACD
jgi:hypothetical protein